MSGRWRACLSDETGTVTAEFAIAMVAVVTVALVGIGTLSAGARHIALQDAVADAARLAARGESSSRVEDLVTTSLPGATVTIEESADLVCVSAVAPGFLGVTIPARSCALAGGW